MKKTLYYTLIATLFSYGSLWAQEWETNGNDIHNTNSGNVGIGTNNPQQKLQIEKSGNTFIRLVNTGSNGSTVNFGPVNSNGKKETQLQFENEFGLYDHFHGVWRFKIADTGNVGIGTVTPSAKLDVEGGDLYIREEVASNGKRRQLRVYGYDNNSKFYGSIHSNYDDAKRTLDISTSSSTQQIKIDASANTSGKISLLPGLSGSVGIGTTTTGTHKLAVEGTIGAREIKVEAGTWSDFVFNKDYPLPTLAEVETHIKAKGHLKDIPSEAEVKANGINLGEMDAKLLQKIEELMLYTIEQHKKIEKMEQEIQQLKQQTKDR